MIRTCLEEIDKCRPYFLGILGADYGLVPEFLDIMMDPDLLARYPWIEEVAMNGVSITEMEFIHGVINNPDTSRNNICLYRREGDLPEGENAEKMLALIERTREKSYTFHQFTDKEYLGRMVYDDLRALIDRYWPEGEEVSGLELQRRAHRGFAASRKHAYIPNAQHLKGFRNWLSKGTTPLIIHGSSGLGKSSLVAYLTDYYRKKHSDGVIIEHYVGASETSGPAVALMQHIIEEIRERYGVEEPLPSSSEEIEQEFPSWLARGGHLATEQGEELLIVLDALNQLDERDQRPGWIPEVIPSGVRLVVSTTPGDLCERLIERGWEELEVVPIEDQRIRQSIIVRYLGEFHKGLSSDQLKLLTHDPKGASPLFLCVVAEELRLYAEQRDLDEEIARYTSAADLEEIFQLVLERLENDYGENEVRSFLQVIYLSRAGLSESEILDLTGMSRLLLSRILTALGHHLVQKNGRLDFFHDYLRRGVEKRYLGEGRKGELHGKLADYFEKFPASKRTSRELLYQLRRADQPERFLRFLANIPHFMVLFGQYAQLEFLEAFATLRHEGLEIDPVKLYDEGLTLWKEGGGEGYTLREVYATVSGLFKEIAIYAEAKKYRMEAVKLAEEDGDRLAEARERNTLAFILGYLGEFDEAISQGEQALKLGEEIDDLYVQFRALDHITEAYRRKGEFAVAMSYLNQNEEILDRLKTGADRSHIYSSKGLLAWNMGDLDKALECFEHHEKVCTEEGNIRGVMISANHKGLVYWTKGSYDIALEQFERYRNFSYMLGNRQGLSVGVGNAGLIHAERGDYDLARSCFEQKEQLCLETGERRGESVACLNIGMVELNRKDYAEALDYMERSLDIAREIGAIDIEELAVEMYGRILVEVLEASEPSSLPPPSILEHIPNAATENWYEVTAEKARHLLTTSLEIATSHNMSPAILGSRLLLAKLEGALGNNAKAKEALLDLLSNTKEENRANIYAHLALLEKGSNEVIAEEERKEYREKALEVYQRLFDQVPKQEYREKIEALTGERVE